MQFVAIKLIEISHFDGILILEVKTCIYDKNKYKKLISKHVE